MYNEMFWNVTEWSFKLQIKLNLQIYLIDVYRYTENASLWVVLISTFNSNYKFNK